MALPAKLKHMNLFNDGNSYAGLCKSVTLPKLSRKMESWRGGGLGGPVKLDFGLGDDGIQLEWTIGGLDLIVTRQWGIAKVDGVQLRWAGSFESEGTVKAVEIVVRGRHEEIDMGDAEAGEDTEHKVVSTCTYYKLVVDGNEEIEIDILNMIERVNGVDRLEEHRKAIGL